MKELKVLTPFVYAGKLRKKGERIRSSNRFATVLVAVGKVSEVKHEDPPRPKTRSMEPQKASRSNRVGPKRQNRQRPYLRSDMRADEDYERSDLTVGDK
jgi:hypothetical protein